MTRRFRSVGVAIFWAISMLSALTGILQAQIITTYAGGASTIGDGALATQAGLNYPLGVATDAAGNIFISDSANCRIRKVSVTSNIISTVAGIGCLTASDGVPDPGDGGPATNAYLNRPLGIAVDAVGNLYVVEFSRLRKIATSGIISTIAGSDTYGYSGDGGPAIDSTLSLPTNVALDNAGNIYIADSGNDRIRKVSPDGTITTVAGNGEVGHAGDGGPAVSAQLTNPTGLAVDSNGNLFIADTGNQRIREVFSDGTIMTIAGNGPGWGYAGDNGPAVSAELNFPQGVLIDRAGNLFVADTGNSRVRKISSDGVISTIAGNGSQGYSGDGGPATLASIVYPQSIAMDATGNLYINSTSNYDNDPPITGVVDYCRIRKVSKDGTITTVAGNGTKTYLGDGGTATQATVILPTRIAFDSKKGLYIIDTERGIVRLVSASGVINTVAGNYQAGGEWDPSNGIAATSISLNGPSGVTPDNAGGFYIADTYVIRKISAQGIMTIVAGTNGVNGYSGDQGPALSAQMFPFDVALDKSGSLLIADSVNDVIRKVDSTGTISTIAGEYPATAGIFPGNGGYSGDGGPAASAQFNDVIGITVDTEGNYYVVDGFNHCIRKITADGIAHTVAGNGKQGYFGDGGSATSAELSFPTSVAVDTGGNLFIADTGNNVVRKVSTDGVITTLAGVGVCGYWGDGDLAAGAALCEPEGVALDDAGNVYVSDTFNNVIRKIAGGATAKPVKLDQHGVTGSWYNPFAFYQGFTFEAYPDANAGVIFGGWFTYDAAPTGQPRWYTYGGLMDADSRGASLTLYQETGGSFDAGPSIGSVPVGTGLLTFADCAHGTFSYNFTDGSNRNGEISILRITANTTCGQDGDNGVSMSDFALSGNWFDQETSGQGFIFDVNPSQNVLFAAWYTYIKNGSKTNDVAGQRWYTIQGTFAPGSTEQSGLSLYETRGGVFNGTEQAELVSIGTVDISFISCGELALSYKFTAGENAGLSNVIHLQRVGPIPSGCQL